MTPAGAPPRLRLIAGNPDVTPGGRIRKPPDRLVIASARLRRLEHLLRHSGRPAEAQAVSHIRDLVDVADVAESRVGMAER
jgi:hypothetical protein